MCSLSDISNVAEHIERTMTHVFFRKLLQERFPQQHVSQNSDGIDYTKRTYSFERLLLFMCVLHSYSSGSRIIFHLSITASQIKNKRRKKYTTLVTYPPLTVHAPAVNHRPQPRRRPLNRLPTTCDQHGLSFAIKVEL